MVTEKQSVCVVETRMVYDKGSWKPLHECLIQPVGERAWFTQNTHMSGDLLGWNRISDDSANRLIRETERLFNESNH